MRTYRWLGLCLTLLLCAAAAHGLIGTALELSKMVNKSDYVVLAKITLFEPQKKRMILTLTENLQGKPAFRQVPVVMEGDKDAKKFNHMPELMKRLALELPVVLFVVHKEDNTFHTLAYTNGTWFEMKGRGNGKEAGVWDLTHAEPVLRQTYKGTTEEMRKLISDHLAGKVKLPGINKKVEPGFGPEIPQGK